MRCSILNMNKNFKDEGDNNEKTLSVYLDGSLVFGIVERFLVLKTCKNFTV